MISSACDAAWSVWLYFRSHGAHFEFSHGQISGAKIGQQVHWKEQPLSTAHCSKVIVPKSRPGVYPHCAHQGFVDDNRSAKPQIFGQWTFINDERSPTTNVRRRRTFVEGHDIRLKQKQCQDWTIQTSKSVPSTSRSKSASKSASKTSAVELALSFSCHWFQLFGCFSDSFSDSFSDGWVWPALFIKMKGI